MYEKVQEWIKKFNVYDTDCTKLLFTGSEKDAIQFQKQNGGVITYQMLLGRSFPACTNQDCNENCQQCGGKGYIG